MGEQQGYLPYPEEFETICVHRTKDVNRQTCTDEIVAPIVTSNYYKHEGGGEDKISKLSSSKLGNSTRSTLENLITCLSKSKYTVCFSSGIGAIMAVVIGMLKQGDRILCSDDIYGGTTQCLVDLAPKFGICTSHLDLTNLSNLEAAITPQTKLLWTENPTNPKLKVVDLAGAAKITKERNVIMATDNSFLTPYLQKPIEYGVDLSVLSVTKYMNGHSDVIMGSVSTNRDDLYKKLRYIQTNFGHVACAFDCHQVLRGLKTLPLRMKRHQYNSLNIARFLQDHPRIESVIHPALPSHPQYELYKKQTSGHSGMIAFYLKGGTEQAVKFVTGLKYFTHAVSLGGYESLVQVPSLTSHNHIPEELKKICKYTDNLIRMSVGLENVCDLMADLDNALNNM